MRLTPAYCSPEPPWRRLRLRRFSSLEFLLLLILLILLVADSGTVADELEKSASKGSAAICQKNCGM